MDITTLIPAFKPKFLPELLRALNQQTYPPVRVIVSDDSPNQVFVSTLKQIERTPLARKLNLVAIRGPQRGGLANFRHLLEYWNGQTELFHILCDDDLIYPEFYRWHAAAHSAGYKCTVSRRWTADESGRPLSTLSEPEQVQLLAQSVLSVSAQELFPSVITQANNWFGEVSNVVMHRDLADLYRELALEGIPYNGLEDIGTFLRASTREPIGFITHFLGFFRQNAEQNTANQDRRIIKLGHVAWLALALASERAGLVTPDQAAHCITHVGQHTLAKYAAASDMAALRDAIARLIRKEPGSVEKFLEAWCAYVEQPVVAEPGKSVA